MDGAFKTRLKALHHVGWSGTWIWLGFLAAFALVEGALLGLLLTGAGHIWQIVAILVLVLVTGNVMHSHLIAFHEAAHGLLCPVSRINDAIGRLLGSLSFLSLELYRAAHQTHHAYLATERDEELWPFVTPGAPRWARRLAAFIELTCGLLFTPSLFLRAFLRPGSVIRNPALRRRIWSELIGIAVFWGVALACVAWWDLWTYWLLMFLAPAWLAGCLQSLRKYIEHMGVTGSTALSATRSVQATGWTGRLVARTLFNEPFHGIHHKYPRLPHEVLPELSSILTTCQPGETPPFPSYRSALWDMLGSLRDPRVGEHWRTPAASSF
jgi:fatty acid desaturase